MQSYWPKFCHMDVLAKYNQQMEKSVLLQLERACADHRIQFCSGNTPSELVLGADNMSCTATCRYLYQFAVLTNIMHHIRLSHRRRSCFACRKDALYHGALERRMTCLSLIGA